MPIVLHGLHVRLDETQPLTPVRIAVLTVSDTRDEESDTSGHLLAERGFPPESRQREDGAWEILFQPSEGA